jgi:hypothetical protein
MANSSNLTTTSTEEVARACVCAFFAGGIKDMVFYGVDSYKITRQAGQIIRPSLLFRGVLPIAFSGSGVAFGTYFVFYYPIRNTCMTALGPNNDMLSVLVASAVSAIPSSLVGVPADVLKKQLVLREGEPDSPRLTGSTHKSRILRTASSIYRTRGLAGFFLGWKVNIFRDVPYAGIKMSLYEGLGRMYMVYKHHHDGINAGTKLVGSSALPVASSDNLNGVEAGVVGFLSGIITAVVTTPIDCVNTRIKSGELALSGVVGAHLEIVRKDGVRALFRGVLPRCATVAFGSTVFWYVQATLLNAMQR